MYGRPGTHKKGEAGNWGSPMRPVAEKVLPLGLGSMVINRFYNLSFRCHRDVSGRETNREGANREEDEHTTAGTGKARSWLSGKGHIAKD